MSEYDLAFRSPERVTLYARLIRASAAGMLPHPRP